MRQRAAVQRSLLASTTAACAELWIRSIASSGHPLGSSRGGAVLVGGLAGGQVADLAPSVAATGIFEGRNGANGGVLGTLAPTTGCVGRIHAAQDRSFYGPEELESSDSVFSTLLPRSGADPGGRAVCRGGGASTIRRSMRFESVHIESLGLALPPEATTSDALEERLAPLYDRLGVSVGRLELMSGIRERRFWPAGTRPSDASVIAGEDALARAGISRDRVGCVVHSAVCRDFMEPATASVVHAKLELPSTAEAFDLSNACLGFANAMALVAGRIERGEIEAGLVVSGEDGGPLVEETIRALQAEGVGRAELKRAYASLTIGSGGAAAVLCHSSVATSSHRLVGGLSRAATQHHELCSGDRADGASGPLMDTDSEALLHAGNALAKETWPAFLAELGWSADGVDRIVTHQVGVAHKRLLFETLGLDHERDFTTVETLGNIGSVSLPATLTLAARNGFIAPGHRVAMQGIGSGLHCLMLGLEW